MTKRGDNEEEHILKEIERLNEEKKQGYEQHALILDVDISAYRSFEESYDEPIRMLEAKLKKCREEKQKKRPHTCSLGNAKKPRCLDVEDQEPSKDKEASEDDDDDGGVLDASEEKYLVEKVQENPLLMVLEGLQSIGERAEGDAVTDEEMVRTKGGSVAESYEYQGRLFHTNKCYLCRPPILEDNNSIKDKTVTMGIKGFYASGKAECVLVIPFSRTFLGKEEKGVNYKATYKPSEYFQIEEIKLDPVSLEYFSFPPLGGDHNIPEHIPDWAFTPPRKGSPFDLAYYKVGKRERCGLRPGKIRFKDLFAGCGGVSQGLSNCNFESVLAVEIDPKAAEAYKKNHKGTLVKCEDVRAVLRDDKLLKDIGRAEIMQGSSPCQGFSRANRTGGKNDKANNDLALEWVHGVIKEQPLMAMFENVPGIWDRKHQPYLRRMVDELLQGGYQAGVCMLNGKDYGDPQDRDRSFIFAARLCAYLPSKPAKTHGLGCSMDIVTVKDALEGLSSATTPRQKSNAKNLPRLDPDSPAMTLLASKSLPLHYEHDGQITIEEFSRLFSYPLGYSFVGGRRDKIRQIGNSVPIEMATAIGRSFQSVLKYKYRGED